MKLHAISVVTITAITLCQAGWAQQDDPKERLISALEKLAQAEQVSFTGSISHEKTRDDDGGELDRLSDMLKSGGALDMASVNPFEGEIEVLVTKEGETVLASTEELPELLLYTDGISLISRKTNDNKDFSSKKIANELPELTSWSRLLQAVKKTELSKTTELDSGKTQITCSLGSRFVPVPESTTEVVSNRIDEEVISAVATFNLDQNDNITSINYVIQYSDPVKEMFKSGAIQVRGVGGDTFEDERPESFDDTLALGMRSVIKLKLADDVSEKAESFQKFASGAIRH